MYPSFREIELLHRKYAPSEELFRSVFTHCQIIWDISKQLMDRGAFTVDPGLVRAGCLLHDIGVYALFDASGNKLPDYNYMEHGIRGEELLRKEHFPEALARLASHHLGLGFTEEDIKKQRLPFIRPFTADTPEERLIMYADKFHSKTTPPRFNTYDAFREYAASFDPEMAERFDHLAEEFGRPDLAPFIRQYGHAVNGEATGKSLL